MLMKESSKQIASIVIERLPKELDVKRYRRTIFLAIFLDFLVFGPGQVIRICNECYASHPVLTRPSNESDKVFF